MERLFIFDTTLRDGEQSPGVSMSKDEKVRIARQLERLRVDVIEAGFPAASRGDFDAVRAVAEAVDDVTVAGLCRATEHDIALAVEALKGATSGRVHTFIATSALHMERKLGMTPAQVLDAARAAVRFARRHCADIEFSPEDASRSDPDFLCRVLEAVIEEGATTINIPDTVGYAVPQQYGEFIRDLRSRIPNADKARWSVHGHNDLGLAVANALAGVSIGGARQVECTINGLGERAGNTALEEVVMAVKTRADYLNLETRIDSREILPTSRLVAQITGFVVQPNKAVVGANAFAHASGVHQDGVLKARQTYEIMRAEDIGWTANRIVLGKLSGRNAFRHRLQELGIEPRTDEAFQAAFARFKDLADKKAEIFDEDLQALVGDDHVPTSADGWSLVSMSQVSGTGERPRATVVLVKDGQSHQGTAEGDGPVDATFKAIDGIAGKPGDLMLYSVSAMTEGSESQGEASVRISREGKVTNGVGADTDILVASAKAYLDALNKIAAGTERIRPQL